MEKNVVSLETATMLQAAGFPQDAAVEWLERPRNLPEYRWDLVMPWQGKFITGGFAAPTAQEIADQIKSEVKVLRLKRWYACDAARKSAIAQMAGEGDTIAEALAALWLNLKDTQP